MILGKRQDGSVDSMVIWFSASVRVFVVPLLAGNVLWKAIHT